MKQLAEHTRHNPTNLSFLFNKKQKDRPLDQIFLEVGQNKIKHNRILVDVHCRHMEGASKNRG
jgi:hypothetical protein